MVGYFPRQDELDGHDFWLAQELADARGAWPGCASRPTTRPSPPSSASRPWSAWRTRAATPTTTKTLRLAVARERKLWLTTELVRAGMERARHWGWPNTYTYTKSLGEQVMAAHPRPALAIVRPSIVESAQRFPFPGWNEGFTTSRAAGLRRHQGPPGIPAGEDTVLDMIPVDHVPRAIIAAAAQRWLAGRERRAARLPPRHRRREPLQRHPLRGAGRASTAAATGARRRAATRS